MKKTVSKSMAWVLSVVMIFSLFVSSASILAGTSLTVRADSFYSDDGKYEYYEDYDEDEDEYVITISAYFGNETVVDIPEKINGYKVTGISECAFADCSVITSVTIPSSVKYIARHAFSDCTNLASVTISHGVESIGECAFYGCTNLASVTIPSSVTSVGYYAFEETAWYKSQPDWLVYTGSVAYKYKGEMSYGTHITLKKNTKGIADFAFAGCSGLTSITIPDSLTNIGEDAFSGCTSLTSITIPDGVTSIGQGAFYGCESLTSVTIPYCLEYIDRYTFEDCDRLVSVIIPNGETAFSEDAFYLCNNVTMIRQKRQPHRILCKRLR